MSTILLAIVIMPSNTKMSTDIEKSAQENTRARNGDRRIIFSERSMLSGNMSIMTLPHPRTGQATCFLVKPGRWGLYEAVSYYEDTRSWFIEDTVESIGSMYMASKFDPLFLVLPFLRAAKKIEPLTQILTQQAFPQLSTFISAAIESNGELKRNLVRVADQKGSTDLNVWQYNEAKTLQYLSDKVQRVCDALIKDNIWIEGGAMSGHYVKTMRKDIDPAIYRRYSHSIISEYLETDLSEKLRKHLCIPNDVENKSSLKRRPPVDEYSNMEKKTKIDGDSVPDLDYSKEFKVKALATMKDAKQKAQQKALVKSAEGSMSITSFFRKK